MKRVIKIYVILSLMFNILLIAPTVNAASNQYLFGYEGEYFISASPQRTWLGDQLNIFEITDEYISFDYQCSTSGRSVVFNADKAYFTNPYTATANGTSAYGDTPWNTNPIRYEFIFTNNNIHLDIYTNSSYLWQKLDFKTEGIVATADNISIILNGNTLEFDRQPVMCGDRVLVPIRKIFEAMGYTVNWYEDKQTAYAVREDSAVALKPGNKTIAYIKNDIKSTYECDVPPQFISDRILVPVRVVSEISGCLVDWNGDTQTVIISADETTPKPTETPKPYKVDTSAKAFRIISKNV